MEMASELSLSSLSERFHHTSLLLQQSPPPQFLSQPDPNNNAAQSKPHGEKYSLRPRSLQVRLETETRSRQQPTQPTVPVARTRRVHADKPKHKPPPLSKYRRKTANARERSRMREINTAFETLRRAVPQMPTSPEHSPVQQSARGEKLTKITTLRLAMNYIDALTRMLREQQQPLLPVEHHHMVSWSGDNTELSELLAVPATIDVFDDLMVAGDGFDMLLESDGESLTFHSDLSEQSTP